MFRDQNLKKFQLGIAVAGAAVASGAGIAALLDLHNEKNADTAVGKLLNISTIPLAFSLVAFKDTIALYIARRNIAFITIAGVTALVGSIVDTLTKFGVGSKDESDENNIWLGITTCLFSTLFLQTNSPTQKISAVMGAAIAGVITTTSIAQYNMEKTFMPDWFSLSASFLCIAIANLTLTFSDQNRSDADKIFAVGAFTGILSAVITGACNSADVGVPAPAVLLSLAMATVCFAMTGVFENRRVHAGEYQPLVGIPEIVADNAFFALEEAPVLPPPGIAGILMLTNFAQQERDNDSISHNSMI